nr:hypothetical protein GCM10020093_059170 [Planobispora longispora]
MQSEDLVPTSKRLRPPVVAVTGAASGIGRAFLAKVASSADFRRVVAIDEQRGDVPDVTWRVLDVRDPLLANRISDIDVLVHLAGDYALGSDAGERRAYNLRAAQTVLTACAAARVRRVVLVTSAMVYGAAADNEVPLPEDAAVAAELDTGIVGDYLEIEALVRRSLRSHPGLEVTVLRPAVLVGPDVDSVVTRHFEAPRLLTVKGCSPAGSSATSTTWSPRWSWPRSGRSPAWSRWAGRGGWSRSRWRRSPGCAASSCPPG